MEVGAQPRHSTGIELISRLDEALPVRQVLAVVEQRIGVGRAGDEEAGDLATAAQEAPVAEAERERDRRAEIAQDVAQVRARARRAARLDVRLTDPLRDAIAPNGRD